MRWHGLPCQVILIVFSTFPFIANKLQTTLGTVLKIVKQSVQKAYAIRFLPHSLSMPQYNNDLWFKTCGLLASYQWFLYVFSHLMATGHMLSNVYIQFHVSTFLAQKIGAMTFRMTLIYDFMCIFFFLTCNKIHIILHQDSQNTY